MKLKHLLIINILLAIIIFLNYFSFNKKKDNVFERTLSSSPISTVQKDFIFLNTPTSRMINSSRNICITENGKDSMSLSVYKFDFSVPILKKEQSLSQNFNLFFDSTFLYSINKGLLYINGSPVNQLKNLKILNLTVFNGEILTLGELNHNNAFILGFYRISPYNFKIEKLITLKENSLSHYPEYFLSYMGSFSPAEEKKSYIRL